MKEHGSILSDQSVSHKMTRYAFFNEKMEEVENATKSS